MRLAIKSLDDEQALILSTALENLPAGVIRNGEMEFGFSNVDGAEQLFINVESTREVHVFLNGAWQYENECNDGKCGRHFYSDRYAERCDECEDASIEEFETANTIINKQNLAS